MSYLRHISTRRLLALVAGCALAIGVGAAAIALAAGGTGTTPPPKPLADAIHDALAAPQPAGVTARIDFTNHLVDAASLQGADPLLTGAKGRLWASGDKLRLELQASDAGGGAGDVQVLLDGDRLHGHRPRREHRLPDRRFRRTPARRAGSRPKSPCRRVARIQQALTSLAAGRDGVRRAAGQRRRPARLHASGSRRATTAGCWAAPSWRGTPSTASRCARPSSPAGNGNPVLELRATDISFGPVAAGDLDRAGARGRQGRRPQPARRAARARRTQEASSRSRASTPCRPRCRSRSSRPTSSSASRASEVRLIDHGGTPGRARHLRRGPRRDRGDPDRRRAGQDRRTAGMPGGSSLPKISINGASGQELDTALGTVLRFQRGGVDLHRPRLGPADGGRGRGAGALTP